MDFDFSEDQEQLRDAVSRWVGKAYGFERRRALVAAGGFSREVWRELADLGLTGLAVPEANGGMGFGAVEAMVVMEELGRGLVMEPFALAGLASPVLLAGSAPGDAWLPRIAAGDAVVVPAWQEAGSRYAQDRVSTLATAGDGNWTISGAKSLVAAGDAADAFVVSASAGGAIGLFLVERAQSGVSTRAYPMQDGSRAAEVRFDRAAATPIDLEHGLGRLEHANDVWIAALAAEAVGAMDALFALTAGYLNTRKQFGVAIASFQALRHRLADCKMQLELARSMSYFATLKLGEAAPARRRALSQAKVQLGQAMRFVGQQCIQMHGGIGCTDEYQAGHFFKRLTCIELSAGDTLHHLGEVSARMQDSAGVFA